MALNLGGLVRLTYAVKDAAGAPTNPSSATLTVTQPDGTLAAGIVVDITPDVTGTLVYDFAPTQAGLHSIAWATTGPATADTDVFTVEAPGVQLISVDEQIEHMRASGVITGPVKRELVQDKCIAATDAVEADLGRYIVRRTVTATAPTSQTHIRLKGPVISVTSVSVDGGTPLTAGTYGLVGGAVWSSSHWGYSSVWPGVVTVTYVAGYPVPPAAVREVAKGVAQGLWQSSQTAFHPGLDEAGSSQELVGASVAGLPDPLRAAYEALRVPGVA